MTAGKILKPIFLIGWKLPAAKKMLPVAKPFCQLPNMAIGYQKRNTDLCPIGPMKGGLSVGCRLKIFCHVWCRLGKESVECRADWSVECRASNSECWCRRTLILVWMSVSDEKNGLVSGVGNTPFMNGTFLWPWPSKFKLDLDMVQALQAEADLRPICCPYFKRFSRESDDKQTQTHTDGTDSITSTADAGRMNRQSLLSVMLAY